MRYLLHASVIRRVMGQMGSLLMMVSFGDRESATAHQSIYFFRHQRQSSPQSAFIANSTGNADINFVPRNASMVKKKNRNQAVLSSAIKFQQ